MTQPTVTQINRDPFARTTLMRECDPLVTWGCKNCGQRPAHFRYRWVSDGNTHPIFFGHDNYCGVECWRSYTGTQSTR